MKTPDFDHVSREIVRSLQTAKQALMLENSHHKCQHTLSREILEHYLSPDIDCIIRKQITQRLAEQIVGKVNKHLQVECVVVFASSWLFFFLFIIFYILKQLPLCSKYYSVCITFYSINVFHFVIISTVLSLR